MELIKRCTKNAYLMKWHNDLIFYQNTSVVSGMALVQNIAYWYY